MQPHSERILLPKKLISVFSKERRIRGAYGGRGSGKTFNFAQMTAVRAYMYAQEGKRGTILCGREWMNSLKDSSMSEVKGAIESIPWLRYYFDIGQDYIRTKNGLVEYTFTGLNRNLDSLKSKSKILIAWIDEAEGVSQIAWDKLEPTVREDGSEIWITWNPEKDGSSTDLRFRKNVDKLEGNSLIVEVNYNDNPWFPKELDALRLRQRETMDPATYAWIWEGAYRKNSDAQVFKDKYRVENFIPQKDWDGPYQGIDWGFSQDPTAAVRCWVYGEKLYVEYEASKIGLELDYTADFIKRNIPDFEKYVAYADSARPESISYVNRHGLPRVKKCEKGKGSVEDGISFLKSFKEIIIHPRCKETINEFNLYSYKVDRLSGDVLPDIVDAFNHILDSLRYSVFKLMQKSKIDYRKLTQKT